MAVVARAADGVSGQPPVPGPEPTSRLLRACYGLPVDRTPIWLMRQAGRYQPDYRRLRAGNTMLEAIADPALACAISLLPRPLGVDGLIVFSDILPPLAGMGCTLEYVEGAGPQIDRLDDTASIDRLACPPAAETMPGTLAAIRLLATEVGTELPVIGFAGAPFTLASYAIEGGSSSAYTRTKSLMYREPAAWDRLMRKLVAVVSDLLIAEAEAGASLLQIFDSWAGVALGRADYLRFVAPYQRMLFAALAGIQTPVINFSTGTFPYLRDVAACGGDVMAVDWRMPLAAAWDQLDGRPIMGNLDPALLLAPWGETEAAARQVLADAAQRDGHIFNLGHGVLPDTQPDTVQRLIELVHAASARDAEPSADQSQPGSSATTAGTRVAAGSDAATAVLLMAYGGPEAAADIPGYLADIRAGRPTPSGVVSAISHNYAAIGGGSPLLAATRAQAAALQAVLGETFVVHVGMRHWRPWIEDVVRSIAESGTRRAIALALAPQFSELSTARYWERIQRGLDLHRLEFEVERIGSYHAAAGLVAALAERTAAGLQHWTEGAAAHVVFTAHSLPVSSTSSGDPYQTEVLATATLVARHLGLPPERWSFAFQSAGRSAEPWLGPALDEHLESLAEQGVQRALVTPVGFVSDHVEVLYDIDVKAKATAERCGIELTRAATVGTHPAFISQLADLVRGVAEWQ